MPANQAPVPGLGTTRALLLLPLVALLYFAGWNSAGNAQTAAVPSYDHIFFVIDENHSRSQVIGPAPYLTGLASANAQSAAYFGVTHPSVNNYMALFSGQTFGGITDGCTVGSKSCHSAATNIADEIAASGRTARGYMEAMPSACYGPHDAGTYTERHNPFPYFDQIRTNAARCNAQNVPYTQLAGDLASAATTPNFVWITPDLNNDMHDGSVARGDAWAQANFPTIFNSPAWKTQRSLLVFTTDEDDFTPTNNVPFIAVSSDGSTKAKYVSSVPATHYSWLRTIEASWNLGQMTGNDAAASPMSDLFTGSVAPSPSPPPTTGVISGTVTNASRGVAIAGATVSDSAGTSTTTDASGAFGLRGLAPGSHTVSVAVTGFKPGTQTVSVTAGTTSSVNFSLVSIPTTGAVAGFVTNASGGAPVAGATVSSDSGGPGATTDAAGAYTLTGLLAGSHALTASATGFRIQTQAAVVSAGTTLNLSFSLTPSATPGGITGIVTNAVGGAALAGAAVTDSGGTSATTDRSGFYNLQGLSPGSHTLTASAASFSSVTQAASVTAGTTQKVNFTLTAAPTTGAIAGSVTNASGGAAIAGATVSESGGASTTTDVSGTYTLSGLTVGSHTLVASATGFSAQAQSASVTAGNTLQAVNFNLAPASAGTPALVQASGATESNASTSLTATFPSSTSPGHLLVLSASVFTGFTSPITSITDSAGNSWTRISAMAVAGHYSDGEMWYAASAAATTSVTVQLARPQVASVAIQEFAGVAASSPLSASTGASSADISPGSPTLAPGVAGDLVVGFIGGHANPQAISVTAAGYTGQGQQTSRTVGNASTSVVTGYKVLTSSSAEAYTGNFASAMYWAAGIASFKATAPLPTTGAVSGTVADASTGAPIAGAMVTDSGGAATRTGASGAYTLTGLAPGNHTLSASATGFSGGTQIGSVAAGSTTQNVSFSLTPSPSPDSARGPIRATFLYDWYPETWRQGSHYAPAVGPYASSNPATLRAQVASMLYAKITTGINSWFGPRTLTDSRINAQLAADHGTAFSTALYYEQEAYGDPAPAQISSDMTYAARYFADPSYLHVDGKPVVFVYADSADNCGMAQRWAQGTAGKNIYVVLKVFRGYLGCADQPSSWHQYSGAREDRQGRFSTTVAPGFWRWGEAAPRLARDPAAFAAAVRDMVATGAQWQLIVSYNEYVEGTQIESTTDMPTCAGQGVFLTILHRDGIPGPC